MFCVCLGCVCCLLEVVFVWIVDCLCNSVAFPACGIVVVLDCLLVAW